MKDRFLTLWWYVGLVLAWMISLFLLELERPGFSFVIIMIVFSFVIMIILLRSIFLGD